MADLSRLIRDKFQNLVTLNVGASERLETTAERKSDSSIYTHREPSRRMSAHMPTIADLAPFLIL
jgi:hypothetical protein